MASAPHQSDDARSSPPGTPPPVAEPYVTPARAPERTTGTPGAGSDTRRADPQAAARSRSPDRSHAAWFERFRAGGWSVPVFDLAVLKPTEREAAGVLLTTLATGIAARRSPDQAPPASQRSQTLARELTVLCGEQALTGFQVRLHFFERCWLELRLAFAPIEGCEGRRASGRTRVVEPTPPADGAPDAASLAPGAPEEMPELVARLPAALQTLWRRADRWALDFSRQVPTVGLFFRFLDTVSARHRPRSHGFTQILARQPTTTIGLTWTAVLAAVELAANRIPSAWAPLADADQTLLARFLERLAAREEFVADAERRLLALTEERNRLLGIAAHDLRSPVWLVLEYAQLLKEENASALEPAAREMLDQVVSLSQAALSVVDGVLDFTRGAAVGFALTLTTFPVAGLVEEVGRLNRALANAKGVPLSFGLPESLGEMTGDRSKLAQVCNNLLSNALKFSPAGAPVSFQVTATPTDVTITVRDQGPGIDPHEVDRLFLPFLRGRAAPTAGEQSTGLGLAIVKQVVDAHGGFIQVDSALGEGTTIAVTLPRIAAAGSSPRS